MKNSASLLRHLNRFVDQAIDDEDPFRKVRSRILLILEIGMLPLLLFFLLRNISIGFTLYAVQNLVILICALSGILLLRAGRYTAAVNLLFIFGMSLVQAGFCLVEMLDLGDAVLTFQLASLNAMIGVVLAGAFAERKRQYWAAVGGILSIYAVHFSRVLPLAASGQLHLLGIITYQLIGLFFVTFIFLSLQRLARLIAERHQFTVQLSDSIAAKQHFFANMSHEIRNPLNGILGAISLLRRTSIHSDQQEILTLLDRDTAELNRMLSNILMHNQFTDKDQIYRLSSCDLVQLVEQVVSTFDGRNTGAYNRVAVESSRLNTRRILSDPAALTQITANLVDNALKFAGDAGPIYIRLSSELLENGRCQLCIEVEDNGPGIAEELKELIFSPYHQGEDGYDKGFSGTGLGLAVVEELTQLLGGEVTLVSSPGEGALFSVSFTAECDYPLMVPEETANDDILKTTVSGDAVRICVAEDNAINLLHLESLLSGAGYAVDSAVDGQEALDCIDKQLPALLILDMQMPGMDGFSCAAHIRAHASSKVRQLPILAVTGYSFAAEMRKVAASGVNEMIVKPFDEDEFLAKISEMLTSARLNQ